MKIERHLLDQTTPFNAQMLKKGEMMEINDNDYPSKKGEILIRALSTEFFILNGNYWGTKCDFKGRKLLPGESVTLIQE